MDEKLEDSDRLKESNGIEELKLVEQWAYRSIVCPPDYGDEKAVADACKLVKSRLEELKKYKQNIKNGR